jgi:hypothetical protein
MQVYLGYFKTEEEAKKEIEKTFPNYYQKSLS